MEKKLKLNYYILFLSTSFCNLGISQYHNFSYSTIINTILKIYYYLRVIINYNKYQFNLNVLMYELLLMNDHYRVFE